MDEWESFQHHSMWAHLGREGSDGRYPLSVVDETTKRIATIRLSLADLVQMTRFANAQMLRRFLGPERAPAPDRLMGPTP